MKMNPVMCRVCKKTIDRNIEKEGIDWVMPSRNFFYHKSCYESFKGGLESPEQDLWYDRIFDYISHDLKLPYNYFKCAQQIQQYLAKGYTTKGIYFALRYFYEVQNGDKTKAKGSIGIVPYIYNESAEYWTNKKYQDEHRMEKIMDQIKEREQQEPPKSVRKGARTRKEKWNLDDI